MVFQETIAALVAMTSQTEQEVIDNAELAALLNDSSVEQEAMSRLSYLKFFNYEVPEVEPMELDQSEDSVVLPISNRRTPRVVTREDKFVGGRLLRWDPDVYATDVALQIMRTSCCSRIVWDSFIDDASSWDFVENHLISVFGQHLTGYLGVSIVENSRVGWFKPKAGWSASHPIVYPEASKPSSTC